MLPQQPNSGAGPEDNSQHTVPPRPAKPWYLRWWAITLGALIVVSVTGNLLGGESSTAEKESSGPAALAAADAAEKTDSEAEAAASSEAAEEAAAKASAEASEQAAEEAEVQRQAEAEQAAVESERKAEAAAQKKAKASEKKRIDSAQPVSVRELSLIVKKPDSHTGETVVVFGEVTQFDSATGACIFRANIAPANMANTWDYDHNAIFTAGDGDADCPKLDPIVADDQVRMTATVVSAFSYDTQIGGSTTVPLFKVEKIARVK